MAGRGCQEKCVEKRSRQVPGAKCPVGELQPTLREASGGAGVLLFGMSAALSVDSEGRIHHDIRRRDVCATRG
jgi:hypothetical protein